MFKYLAGTFNKYFVHISLRGKNPKYIHIEHWCEKCAYVGIYYVFAWLAHTLQIIKEISRKSKYKMLL